MDSVVFAPDSRALDGMGPARRRQTIRIAAIRPPSTNPIARDRPICGTKTAASPAERELPPRRDALPALPVRVEELDTGVAVRVPLQREPVAPLRVGEHYARPTSE